MNNTELKQCPFCGQYMVTDEGKDVREHCSCDGAKKYQAKLELYQIQTKRLEKICGEECADIKNTDTPEENIFKPVSNEAYSVLSDLLYAIVFGLIGKTTVKLADDTTLTISKDAVKRKVTIEKGN